MRSFACTRGHHPYGCLGRIPEAVTGTYDLHKHDDWVYQQMSSDDDDDDE